MIKIPQTVKNKAGHDVELIYYDKKTKDNQPLIGIMRGQQDWVTSYSESGKLDEDEDSIYDLILPKPFDPSKPCQTRDGKKARVICKDAKGDQSLIVLIYDDNLKKEDCFSYYPNGRRYYSDYGRDDDLINIDEDTK